MLHQPKKIDIRIKSQEKWRIKAIKSCNPIDVEIVKRIDKEAVIVYDLAVGSHAVLEYPDTGKALRTSKLEDVEELTETTALLKTENSLYLLERVAATGSEVLVG